MAANLVGFVIGTDGIKFFVSQLFGTSEGGFQSSSTAVHTLIELRLRHPVSGRRVLLLVCGCSDHVRISVRAPTQLCLLMLLLIVNGLVLQRRRNETWHLPPLLVVAESAAPSQSVPTPLLQPWLARQTTDRSHHRPRFITTMQGPSMPSAEFRYEFSHHLPIPPGGRGARESQPDPRDGVVKSKHCFSGLFGGVVYFNFPSGSIGQRDQCGHRCAFSRRSSLMSQDPTSQTKGGQGMHKTLIAVAHPRSMPRRGDLHLVHPCVPWSAQQAGAGRKKNPRMAAPAGTGGGSTRIRTRIFRVLHA